jgi:signal transduction histidine kinase
LAKPLETVVFRIVQECLTNVVKHSGSHRVRISLAQHGEQLQVDVQDWGIGFELDQVGERGFGLRGIRERARLFGGNAAIESSRQEGARIVVGLPLTKDAPD